MRLHLLKTALLMIALSTASLACESDTSQTEPAEPTAEQAAAPSEEAAPAEEPAPDEQPAEEAAPTAQAPPEGQGQLDDPSMSELGGDELDAAGATRCYSNDDCEADEVCYSNTDAPTDYYCVPGTRGSRDVGEPCDEGVGSLQCATGICLWHMTEDGGTRVCTRPCETHDECPETLPRCLLGVCNSPTGD